mgnify:CR=1 FL=1
MISVAEIGTEYLLFGGAVLISLLAFTAVPSGPAPLAVLKTHAGSVEETRRTGKADPSRMALSGPDAERWLLPNDDRAQLKMGFRSVLHFDETRDGLADHITADVATVGIGWLLLPDDPREVVLQRVLVSRQRAGERPHPCAA